MSGKSRSRRRPQPQLEEDEIPYIPPRTEEQILITALSSFQAERILCSSQGRGQLAGFLASQNPDSLVQCHFLDSHYAELARKYWLEAEPAPQILCQPDFPPEQYDAICIPVNKQGNAELTRDLLQTAWVRLKPRGELFAAVNNPTDSWLNEQFRSLFPKVTRIQKKQGVFYKGRKVDPPPKLKTFEAEFSAPIGGRQVSFVTRPGVFSHRRIDAGAWALIKSLKIQHEMRVLDLGCGCGAVGIAAMLAADRVEVTALDSDARAVSCTRLNAERALTAGQLERFTAICTHTCETGKPGQFDLVACNPPYFSHFEIASRFITAAKKNLCSSGEMLIVTKMPQWYEENLPEFFNEVEIEPVGHYFVVRGYD